jgi:hypothetical protein
MALLAEAVVGACSWVKRCFVRAPTEDQLRENAKAKQREIRRELRGLPPENDSPKV